MKTFKNNNVFVYFMKRLTLIFNYFSKFLLLLSLLLTTTDFMKGLELTLLIITAYVLYRITRSDNNKDSIKEYNYLHVATIFIFALYASGFTYMHYNKIVLGLLITSFIGILLSVLYQEKKKNAVIIKPSKKELAELKEILTEAKTIEKADELIKQIEAKNILLSKKTTNKKKSVKKTAKKEEPKKTTEKKVVKKITKKTPVKKKAVKKVVKKTPAKKKVVKKVVKN